MWPDTAKFDSSCFILWAAEREHWLATTLVVVLVTITWGWMTVASISTSVALVVEKVGFPLLRLPLQPQSSISHCLHSTFSCLLLGRSQRLVALVPLAMWFLRDEREPLLLRWWESIGMSSSQSSPIVNALSAYDPENSAAITATDKTTFFILINRVIVVSLSVSNFI